MTGPEALQRLQSSHLLLHEHGLLLSDPTVSPVSYIDGETEKKLYHEKSHARMMEWSADSPSHEWAKTTKTTHVLISTAMNSKRRLQALEARCE